jgi:hypothetical protein
MNEVLRRIVKRASRWVYCCYEPGAVHYDIECPVGMVRRRNDIKRGKELQRTNIMGGRFVCMYVCIWTGSFERCVCEMMRKNDLR